MFSGIISAVAKIKKVEEKKNDLFLTIQKPKGWHIKAGDSIATNGVCLTVKKVNSDSYITELMSETLSRTYFGKIKLDKVNLERPLTLSTPLDGHFVTGHVDSVGKIKEIVRIGQAKIFKIGFPKKFNKLVVEKGSITIDGISLTVVDVGSDWFTVSLVDYTLEHTTMDENKKNDLVHLEFDILAKYLNKIIKKNL